MPDLLAWRRDVADLFATVRDLPAAEGHARWVAAAGTPVGEQLPVPEP